MRDELQNLRGQLEGIAGAWDGDKPGLLEERAIAAGEAIGFLDNLEERLDKLSLHTID